MYIISVWQPSLRDAHAFIEKYRYGAALVQMLPDIEMRFAYWVVLRLTGDQRTFLREVKEMPKITFMDTP